jgi:antitoxin VapB
MGIRLKSAKIEQLAREVAQLSGESLTQAIIHALEERLEQLKARRSATRLAEEILQISQRCSALPNLDQRNPDEIVGYDGTGIPK